MESLISKLHLTDILILPHKTNFRLSHKYVNIGIGWHKRLPLSNLLYWGEIFWKILLFCIAVQHNGFLSIIMRLVNMINWIKNSKRTNKIIEYQGSWTIKSHSSVKNSWTSEKNNDINWKITKCCSIIPFGNFLTILLYIFVEITKY